MLIAGLAAHQTHHLRHPRLASLPHTRSCAERPAGAAHPAPASDAGVSARDAGAGEQGGRGGGAGG